MFYQEIMPASMHIKLSGEIGWRMLYDERHSATARAVRNAPPPPRTL